MDDLGNIIKNLPSHICHLSLDLSYMYWEEYDMVGLKEIC